ncbi:hypothetical protein PANT_14d00123 [Moesziomyces antarcticus T-34]|uniref:FAD-binding PCMH-type domain-containing protein n=1 Tax=Pseudozyma antarctica (strain T-34) TaxID=1151754 RepID=M9M4F3_PSEA3|nr:hypothetical protein PANT_14d00123 [Moesziomyces antarcticus T-34]
MQAFSPLPRRFRLWTAVLAVAGSLLFTSVFGTALPVRSAGTCVPGHPCFPSEASLDEFNRTVHGRLRSERPIASVCYPSDSSFNTTECAVRNSSATSFTYRTGHFASLVYNNWEQCDTQACSFPLSSTLLDPSEPLSAAPCEQASVPSYSVHARTEEDVQSYVSFATRHNLRIVIKNTGHDLLGRSAGKGGFALWTHELRKKVYHTNFQLTNCSHSLQHPVKADSDVLLQADVPRMSFSGAITLGAGVQWADAYKFASEHRRHIVGGASTTVGAAGGYLQGGGHSYLTPSYGLAVDNLLEARIVTSDGRLYIANEVSNPDLFWALRGGGGATWGVVTSVTYKTRPQTTIYQLSFSTLTNVSEATFNQTMQRYIRLSPKLAEIGVGGAATFSPTSLSFNLVVPNTSTSFSSFKAITRPLLTFLHDKDGLYMGGKQLDELYTIWPNHYDFYVASNGGDASDSGAGTSGGGGVTSRVLPRTAFTDGDQSNQLAQLFLDSFAQARQSNTTFFQVIGLATPINTPYRNQTSLNPSWYRSLWHVINLGDMADKLREMTPDAAVYLGESSVSEPDYRSGYWGRENYKALQDIKQRWDPANHFAVFHGVNFDKDDLRWSCYQADKSTS